MAENHKMQFVNDVLYKLDNNFAPQEMSLIKQIIETTLVEYDMSPYKQLPDIRNDDVIEIYKMFIVAKKIEGLSKNSLRTYNSNTKTFFEENTKPLKEITTNDVRLYLYNEMERGISMQYAEAKRTALNSFFTWCYKERYIDHNPMENINTIKYVQKPVEPLTEMELEQCREAYTKLYYRDQVIFEFCYSTGCRAFEVGNLKKQDLNLEKREARILGKGQKYRTVYLNEKTVFMLQKYFESRKGRKEKDSDYVFVSVIQPYHRLHRDGIEKIFKDLERLVGFHVHPHKMRHTTATVALNRGMPIEEVQKLLGHSSCNTTLIYAAVNDENLKYHHKQVLSA